jgi:ferritin-like metal-binding protein YciE/hemerythrin-like domain-containing protein
MRTLVADRGMGEPITLGAALLTGKKVAPDALGLLEEDHRTVLGWFEWYAACDDRTRAHWVAHNIVKALRAHMAAEEEVFYPEARRYTGDEQLVARAVEEHAGAKTLMDRIDDAQPGKMQDETVRALETEIRRHVTEEETELFGEVEESRMARYAVGAAVATRRVDHLFKQRRAEKFGGSARTASLDSPASAAGGGDEVVSANEQQTGQLEEFPTMAISQDAARTVFVTGLKNSHAAARECRTMVAAQANRLESYPDIRERLELHLQEKDRQLERLESILDGLGESRSAFKDTTMSMMAAFGNMANAAADDEVIKGSMALLGLAKVEAAGYETLLLFGEAAGADDALRPLQQCLSEERSIASFVEDNLRATGMRFLQLRSEGRDASH